MRCDSSPLAFPEKDHANADVQVLPHRIAGDGRNPAETEKLPESHQHREGGVAALDRPVQGIPLHRLAACLADQLQQLGAPQTLRGGGSGVVVNTLLDDGAIDIVGAATLPPAA